MLLDINFFGSAEEFKKVFLATKTAVFLKGSLTKPLKIYWNMENVLNMIYGFAAESSGAPGSWLLLLNIVGYNFFSAVNF